jgi:predicted AlkP superfamily phosphohydrolase/phosphomutase
LHQTKLAPIPLSAEPKEVLNDVRQTIGQPPAIPEFKVNTSFAEDLQTYQTLLEQVEKKGALCRYLLSRDEFELCVTAFDETHTASHQFWKYRPEAQEAGPSPEESKLTHAIRDVYQAIDRQMDMIMEQLPAGANIFILSLFGMDDQYPTAGLNEVFCRRLGYHVQRKSVQRVPRPIDLVRRVVPESWRIALSRHLSQQMQENLISDLFSNSTDWQKTTAFAIPSLYTGFVRVNLRGREPEGIVEPGSEYESLLRRLEEDFKQLVDPSTGEQAVDEVVRAVDVFGGPPPISLPDLFVEWKPGARFLQRVEHPQVALVQQKPAFCPGSEETLCSFIAAAGPSIKEQGAIGDISLLDLAPTFLSLMGESIPDPMTGKVIEVMSAANTDL